MDRMDYIQAVVRTRVLEKKLLTQEKMVQLVEADDIHELWKILETTDYAEQLAKLTSFYNYEDMLMEELNAAYTAMREISPDPKIINIAALKYDYHNLKVYCKEQISQTSLAELYLPYGAVTIEKLATENPTKKSIDMVLADYKEMADPQRIDLLLDQFYIKDLVQKLEIIDLPIFSKYVKAEIDFLNIRTVIRLQKQKKDIDFLKGVILEGGNLSPDVIVYTLHDSIQIMMQKFRNIKGSKSVIHGLEAYEITGQLTDFEKQMDDFLMDILQEAKQIHFGPEPLLAYLLAKEQEIKNLRMIITSKQNQIQTELIHKRVREVYV